MFKIGDRVNFGGDIPHWHTVTGTVHCLNPLSVAIDKEAKYANGELVMSIYREKPMEVGSSLLRLEDGLDSRTDEELAETLREQYKAFDKTRDALLNRGWAVKYLGPDFSITKSVTTMKEL